MTNLTIPRLLRTIKSKQRAMKWALHTNVALPFEQASNRARNAMRIGLMRATIRVNSFCQRYLTLILLALTLSNLYLLVTK